jgi:hypothetical protein
VVDSGAPPPKWGVFAVQDVAERCPRRGGYQGNQAGRGGGGGGGGAPPPPPPPPPLLEQICDLAIWDRRDFSFSQGDFFHKRLEISGEIFPF